jgi:hypothetical protein
VLGHKGIEGNKIADQLAKRGLLHPFIGPESACGMSERVPRWVIRDGMCGKHQEYWQSIPGQRHAKRFLSKLSAKRKVNSLKLNRSQTREVTGLLSGHLSLKASLLQTGYN